LGRLEHAEARLFLIILRMTFQFTTFEQACK
jgi:hypothetical protein